MKPTFLLLACALCGHARDMRHRQDCLCYTPAKQPVLVVTSVLSGVSNFRRCVCAGVSLIEILVVIAIIAILFVLITPAVKSTINSANRTKCLGNLRQIGVAAELYTQDNNNMFPDINVWPVQLGVYLLPGGDLLALPTGTKTVFWCPAVTVSTEPTTLKGLVEYGINAGAYAGLGKLQQTSANGFFVINNSKRVAFMDAVGPNVWDTTPNRINLCHGSNNYNGFFADGHAEVITTQQYPLGSSAWKNLMLGYKGY